MDKTGMKISIIIPVYQEGAIITTLLERLERLSWDCDILFVDGGSSDDTKKIIKEHGFRVITSPQKGRAHQMNDGAARATGDILWFLHADSLPPADAPAQIRALVKNGYCIGCFPIRFDVSHPLYWSAALFSNWRVWLRNIAFGDQGIFLTAGLFKKLGGYAPIPLMEDYQLSLDTKKAGLKIGLAKGHIITSGRRFTKNGIIKTIYHMQRLQHQFRKGVDIERIARAYFRLEDRPSMKQEVAGCVHCGKCMNCCAFLKKYDLDLDAYAKRPDLAYHCFLCGACRRACPAALDGRKISLHMRQARVRAGYRPGKDGYGLLLMEKRDYLFQNYRRAIGETALFPGCNFPAYFPETMRYLSRLLAQKGIGTVYDCCAKPISELGLYEEETRLLDRLSMRLKKRGIKELVVLCPNCYFFLNGRLTLNICSIYEKLEEWGLPVQAVELAGKQVFAPCPDRGAGELWDCLSSYTTGQTELMEYPQCCGSGGLACVREPQLARDMRDAFQAGVGCGVYTYCATCAGRIAKSGTPVQHLLCNILGAEEKPAVGIRSFFNRVFFKFR